MNTKHVKNMVKSKKNFILSFGFFLLMVSSVFAFELKAVVFQVGIQKQKTVVHLNVQKGFGVQKEGRHVFELYELSPSASSYTSVKDKIKNAATKVDSVKSISGINAIEDAHYYAKINPLYFKKTLNSQKQYAFMAKVYVCSFDNGFCSVQREYRLLP